MKRIALTLFPVLGLVGCGTLPAPPLDTAASIQSDGRADGADGVDYAKMARIERVARGRGIGLIWVNPPRLKVAAAAVSNS